MKEWVNPEVCYVGNPHDPKKNNNVIIVSVSKVIRFSLQSSLVAWRTMEIIDVCVYEFPQSSNLRLIMTTVYQPLGHLTIYQ